MIEDSNYAALVLQLGNSCKEDGNYEKSLSYLNEANHILNILSNKESVDREANLLNYLISLEKIASVYASLSDLEKSFEYIQKHYNFTSTHFTPTSSSSIISQFLLANYYFSVAELEKSEEYFTSFKSLCKSHLQKNPDDIGGHINLGKAYCYLGNIHFERGEILLAYGEYKNYTNFLEKLIQKETDNNEIKYDLAVSFYKLTQIYQKIGKTKEAIGSCTNYVVRVKELYEKNQYATLYSEALTSGYYLLGRMYLDDDFFAPAKKYFEEYYNLKLHLSLLSPQNLNHSKDIILANRELATIYLHEGNTDKALKNYEFCYEQIKNIIEKEIDLSLPTSNSEEILSIILESLIDILGRLGQYQKALVYANESFQICLKLYKNNPDLYNHEGLVYAYTNLAEVLAHLNQFDKGIINYKMGLELLELLINQSPNTVQYQNQKVFFQSKLKLLEKKSKG